MRRLRSFKPRRGIRFDNRRVQGPNGGFIASDIEVVQFTGSVSTSIAELDRRFEYPGVPFAGYPDTADELSAIVGGTWSDGWLMEELTGSLTSSFGNLSRWNPQDTGQIWHLLGPRGAIDGDFAVGFASGVLSNIPAFSLDDSRYNITPTTDLLIMWVGKGRKLTKDFGTFLEKENGSIGWTLDLLGDAHGNVLQFQFFGTSFITSLTGSWTNGNFYLGLIALERSSGPFGTLVMATKDLITGFLTSSLWDLTPVAGIDFSNPVAVSFGGRSSTINARPDQFECSAMYLGSGSNVAAGFVANHAAKLNSLAATILAPQPYLFSGSREIDGSIGTFGAYDDTRFLNQRLLGLGTASLGRARGVSIVTTGSIPSWTNRHIKNSSFVITTLSSSDHESQVLGYRRSGSEALETSAVPAYRTLFFSKRTVPYTDPGTGFSRTSAITYPRTYGIVLNTGTIDQSQYAAIYRLSGALADMSGTAPGWLLNNGFGVPVIPLSSASLVSVDSQAIVGMHPQDAMVVRPILDGARRLSDAARDANPTMTLIEQFDVALSGTTT